MRIILTQQAGSSSAQTIWLTYGQQATIGRTNRADYVIGNDGTMSGMHFALESRAGSWYVRDLDSRHGTFVQEQRITEARLHHRATIRAGATVFVVDLEEASHSRAEAPAQNNSVSQVPTQSPVITPSNTPSNTPRKIQPERAQIRVVTLFTTISQTTIRRLWLHPGESFTVGSNDEADHAFPNAHLATSHFRLSCQEHVCRLESLQTTSNVQVNGQPVSATILKSDDQIVAGDMNFDVSIEYDLASAAPAAPLPAYQVTATSSGLHRFSSVGTSDVSVADVANAIRALMPMYLIVSPPIDKRYDLTECIPLFDWVPKPFARRKSPFLIPIESGGNLDFLMNKERNPGDAAFFFSRCEQTELVRHLRLVARAQMRSTSIPKMECWLGDWRPAQLLEGLTNCDAEFAKFVFSQIDFLLCEGDAPGAWQALGANRQRNPLTEIGWIEQRGDAER